MRTPSLPATRNVQHTLNVGILAHVDAGKTSLTERLLFDTGVIDRLGGVDTGDTQTDTGDIERQRGITVRSAVVSFTTDHTQVNLIDTPGHADFVAEVERALGVLDAAVLVVSAVEGVQAHTRLLMRTLRGMGLPTLLFVNKIDRSGARDAGLLDDIRRRLSPRVVAMTRVTRIGTPEARALPLSLDDPSVLASTGEVLAECDDALLARMVDGPLPTAADLRAVLAEQVGGARVFPVYFGAALSGEGIGALVDGMTGLLGPALRTPYVRGAATGPDEEGGESRAATAPRGTVFAVDRGPGGERRAYLRLFAGELAPRRRVTLLRREADGSTGRHTGRITSLHVVGREGQDATVLTAGNIGRITGLPGVRPGDRLSRDEHGGNATPLLPAPTLRTTVRPRHSSPGATARLHAALLELADRDPLIHAEAEPDGATRVLLYGEVQKEIIAATLVRDHGIEADFAPSAIICVERPAGSAEACEEMGWRAPTPDGRWATVGLRVDPLAHGSGCVFRYETELGALPPAFHRAVEESVHAGLREGPGGWVVTDCAVTLVRSAFVGPLSTAGDFREVTRLVLRRALARAGTRVYEPCHAFEADVPLDCLAPVTACLARLGAHIRRTSGGTSSWLVEGVIPARAAPEAQRALPGLSHGEGVWWSRPDGDRPLEGKP
ncbi:TetM/TetW/TetO/TetS family tetracycline resistance ribosomal protection protein [Streptomyces sp. PTM05]|uniref:TetM/TetW/TetO/TetS family tetracycline resistance ribosomal protection protein n=1 Tax=Streptantibioticus parmotrematis TaxID=2873249 RepID=A0ABS7QPP9_9ACTN|nr:TetM/TetW/TetO/TetS family tetracycline resistance ribosomal protection protein [Streptantibioticus parmotrematis]MBY8885145.1 TetM/TetW/TetO/TetS family tetracycline resistance ribosomal protection protein [Streptantibioticus parmotrematis]